jgi:3-hydroxybutyryl-CoA dehydrogenase
MSPSEAGGGPGDGGGAAWPRRAAVVGAGTMGGGFAQLLALAGVECVIADASPEAAEAACERAVAEAAGFAAAGLMPEDAASRIAERLRAADDVAGAAEGADVLFEAVTEDPTVKVEVLTAAEAALAPDAILATNTSAIPIAELAGALRHPERFLGVHWFNPALWVPCVELIAGPATSATAVDAMEALLRTLGKRPVRVGDGAGFVGNRIQFAMFREAALVVAEGLATAEQVDDVVRHSFGWRLPFLGPFQIADFAGLDVYAGAYRALEAAFGERLAAPALVEDMVAQGRLGVKSGAGSGSPRRTAPRRSRSAATAPTWPSARSCRRSSGARRRERAGFGAPRRPPRACHGSRPRARPRVRSGARGGRCHGDRRRAERGRPRLGGGGDRGGRGPRVRRHRRRDRRVRRRARGGGGMRRARHARCRPGGRGHEPPGPRGGHAGGGLRRDHGHQRPWHMARRRGGGSPRAGPAASSRCPRRWARSAIQAERLTARARTPSTA